MHKFIWEQGNKLAVYLYIKVRSWNNMSSNNNKQFAFNQLIWIVISIGISLAISRLLPFPISIVAIVGVFIVLGYFMRNRMSGKMGMRGGLRGTSGTTSRAPGDSSLKYYCMICGTEHKQIECPKCGSKLKRVGSWSKSLDAPHNKENVLTRLDPRKSENNA